MVGLEQELLNDVRTRNRKVTTPSLKEVRATTGVVIVTVALFAIYFYGIDRVIGFFIDHLFQWAKNSFKDLRTAPIGVR